MDALDDLDLSQLSALLHGRDVSPVELAEHSLARIEELDGELHAFATVTRERALDEARRAERELAAGDSRGVLHGIPYAVKDLFDVAGEVTGAGCRLLADNVARADCTVVGRLADAGMVLVGKTHTVQFAFGGAGVNHDTGTPRNPWRDDVHCVPGGSSSGSGVAVAARLVPAALGTDTSGSVRIPASLCGVTGLKTTVGRVSRAGVYPLSPTLDSVGPLARTAADTARVYEAIQGADPDDRTTAGQVAHDVTSTIGDGLAGMRLAFVETMFFDGADRHVVDAVRATREVFEALGAEVVSIELPEVDEVMGGAVVPTRARTVAAEGYAVNRRLLEESFDDLDPVVAERMRPGADLAAVDYLEAFEAWGRLRASVEQRTGDIDAFLVPSTPITARPLADLDASLDAYFEHNGLYLRNTSIGNRLEWCGVSVPCGSDHDGLPVGVTIHAPSMREEVALRVANAYQHATEWHLRRPVLAR